MKYFALLFLVSTALAQNVRYDSVAWGPKGPVPNATIAVCTQPANTSTTPCTPLASLCSSLTDATCNQPNPFFADNLGNFHFYLKPVGSPVSIQIYGPNVAVPLILSDQLAGVGTSTGGGSVFPTSTISTSSLAFGSITLGSTSPAQVVTLTNTGTPQVTISAIAVTGDFAESTTCGTVLAQAASCTIGVTFTPSATGARTGTLTVTSDAASSPQTVSLTGTGLGNTGAPVTWSSVALSPTTPTVTIPNTLQMAANYTPSAGSVVNGTNQSSWTVSGASGGSGGSWTVRNHGGATVASGTSRACPAMNVTSGDLLVIGVYIYNSASLSAFTSGVTDTQANTYTLEPNLDLNAQHREFIAFAIAGATGSDTITATQSSSVQYFGVKCADVGGVNAVPLDVVASQNAQVNTASMTTPAFTTTASPDFVFALFSDATGTNAPTAGTNWTALDTDSTFRAISEYQLISPAGSYTASATDVTATSVWQAYAVAFKPAASVGVPFATISQTGLLTAQAAGTAAITAEGGEPVQQAQSLPSAAATSTTVTFPNAQTAGNVNDVVISWPSATGSITSVTDSAGNTYTCPAPSQGNGNSVAVCTAGPIAAFSTSNGTGNVVTVNMGQSTTGLNVIIEERAFPVNASILDGAAVNATGAAGPATASITTTNANDVVIVGLGLTQGISSVLAPFTADNLFPNATSIVSAPAFSAGTQSATIQLTGGAWVSQAVALKVLSASTNATIATQAVTNVYYMAPSNASPPGSDTNPGTQSQPFLSFSKVLATIKANGVGVNGTTVFLENGKYGPATGTGYLVENCAAGGNGTNGTGSGAQVTWIALNERQAEIDGSASGIPVLIQNCSWFTLQGLHIENGDFTTQPSFNYDAMIISGDSNFTLKRNIFAHANRFQNAQLLAIEAGSTNGTVQENEFYYFHRHAIMVFGNSTNVEVLRNYCNSRNYPDLSNGYVSSFPATGDTCVMPYGAQNNTFENNIDENDGDITNCQPNGGQTCNGNTFLGNIGLNNIDAYFADSHQGTTCPPNFTSTSNCPSNQNDTYTNNVSISPQNWCFALRSGNYTVTQGSCFNPKGNTTALPFGFFSDIDPATPGASGPYDFNLTNDQAQGVPSPGSAFEANTGVNGTWNFVNSSGSTNTFKFPATVTVTNNTTTTAATGSCFAWIPATSPLHGAGSGAADIGANVLFEYSGGTLTGTAIWSSSAQCKLGQTNCFVGTGAIVTGLNDVAGSSLYDVGGRLNINVNGCSYPAGYNPAF